MKFSPKKEDLREIAAQINPLYKIINKILFLKLATLVKRQMREPLDVISTNEYEEGKLLAKFLNDLDGRDSNIRI